MPTTTVLVLCTGNAARSVMAGIMLQGLADEAGAGIRVATGGTHAVDNQPVSARTRMALLSVDAPSADAVSRHRSHQVQELDFEKADLVVAMEADHVRYVRRRYPRAAARTATIRRLCRELPPGPPDLGTRVAALGLADADLGDDEDVADPAGGDDARYETCARELLVLCQELAGRL
ncbi:MAG: low molecular weight phosphatase family protein [Actinomycetota bacterium]|nr:low molecular weight phosphatase family protein [Actinomycetota bacterium]